MAEECRIKKFLEGHRIVRVRTPSAAIILIREDGEWMKIEAFPALGIFGLDFWFGVEADEPRLDDGGYLIATPRWVLGETLHHHPIGTCGGSPERRMVEIRHENGMTAISPTCAREIAVALVSAADEADGGE